MKFAHIQQVFFFTFGLPLPLIVPSNLYLSIIVSLQTVFPNGFPLLTEYLADSNSLAQIKADKAIKGSGTFLNKGVRYLSLVSPFL
jgi:hypothetical protein